MKDDSEFAIFQSVEKKVWKADCSGGLDEGELVEEGMERMKVGVRRAEGTRRHPAYSHEL